MRLEAFFERRKPLFFLIIQDDLIGTIISCPTFVSNRGQPARFWRHDAFPPEGSHTPKTTEKGFMKSSRTLVRPIGTVCARDKMRGQRGSAKDSPIAAGSGLCRSAWCRAGDKPASSNSLWRFTTMATTNPLDEALSPIMSILQPVAKLVTSKEMAPILAVCIACCSLCCGPICTMLCGPVMSLLTGISNGDSLTSTVSSSVSSLGQNVQSAVKDPVGTVVSGYTSGLTGLTSGLTGLLGSGSGSSSSLSIPLLGESTSGVIGSSTNSSSSSSSGTSLSPGSSL